MTQKAPGRADGAGLPSLRRWQQDIDEKHLDVLDGVRVLLLFVVAWFHIWQQSWLMPIFYVGPVLINLDFIPRSGYIAVDGLIFLSGLLMMYPYAGTRGAPPDARRFYLRRLIRVMPGYLLCMAVSLFADALPSGRYQNAWECARDLLAHLTFTHTWFPFSYTGSPLNGVMWTLAVEVQFYALFPLVCRLYQKHPAWTAGCMTMAALVYRRWAAGFEDTSLLINQLPAFLDIYAWGFLAATAIRALRQRLRDETAREKVFFTVVALAGIAVYVRFAQDQAAEPSIEGIRLGQMNRRFGLGAAFCLTCVGLCFSLPAARLLFGGPHAAFLSSVSYAYYLWHQMVTLHLKEWRVPPSVSLEPWVYGEAPWQWQYVLLCFLGSLAAASAVTYLYEKPLQKRLYRVLGRG